MAAFLLKECLEKIFLHFLNENLSDAGTSIKKIHPFTLVSKHWCMVSTPLLYSCPFNATNDDVSFFMLIRTLISCVPELFSSPTVTPKFNYIEFIRELILDEQYFNLVKVSLHKTSFLPTYISDHNAVDDQFAASVITKFVNHLCKGCRKLKKLDMIFSKAKDNKFFNDMIESLNFNDFDGESTLDNVKQLHCSYYSDKCMNGNAEVFSSKDIYSSFLNDIHHLHHLYNKRLDSDEVAKSLSQLISNQKNLKYITLSENCTETSYEESMIQLLYKFGKECRYNIVYKSLSTQSESLQVLEFENLYIGNMNVEAINSLCSLKHIKELKLYQCNGFVNDEIISWAKSMKELKQVEISGYIFTAVAEKFLISLIQSSCNTLTKFVLHCSSNYINYEEKAIEFFNQVPLYLIFVVHLELPKVIFTDFISIIKSCTQLKFISIILDRDLWKRDFRILAEHLPKNLKTIQFREMVLMFNFDRLKYFFEECNKSSNSKFKIIEIQPKHSFGSIWPQMCTIGQEYFDLAESYGYKLVQLY